MIVGDFSGVVGSICMILMLIHAFILFRAYKKREIYKKLDEFSQVLQKHYLTKTQHSEANISIQALKLGLEKGFFDFDESLKQQFRQIVQNHSLQKEVTINLIKTA